MSGWSTLLSCQPKTQQGSGEAEVSQPWSFLISDMLQRARNVKSSMTNRATAGDETLFRAECVYSVVLGCMPIILGPTRERVQEAGVSQRLQDESPPSALSACQADREADRRHGRGHVTGTVVGVGVAVDRSDHLWQDIVGWKEGREIDLVGRPDWS
ncbi:hypothetical protein CDEST_11563 [Colletotrichum destructivum]|uniref:Uncharacterized protein n=1 Tax=Colletotrichum destructivum TaxID=34406 RepID=A0AAX4ITI6_9PEZI|nr:hypothetical protein CDEST_11563 [Colletotrichum destructivum]